MVKSVINESTVKQSIINNLKSLGYQYLSGETLKPDKSGDGERETYSDVLLVKRLKQSLQKINPEIRESGIDEAIKKIKELSSTTNLVEENEAFQRMITDGVTVSLQPPVDGKKTTRISIFDQKNLENNNWLFVDELIVKNKEHEVICDGVVFVNGFPLVIMELKSPSKQHTNTSRAYQQLKNYISWMPKLFRYNGFLVVSDGHIAKAGTITANEERFMNWRTRDGENVLPVLQSNINVLIEGMLHKGRLLDIITHFTLFTKMPGSKSTVKILAAYHQFMVVNKAIRASYSASGKEGNRRIGVVWHTQGSGKSLSMVFFAGKLVLQHNNPTIVVVTDRNDLDQQLFNTFSSCRSLLRNVPKQVEYGERKVIDDEEINQKIDDAKQAKSVSHLKECLSVDSGGIIFTTIQKFRTEPGEAFPVLTDRRNVFVITDEAHRSQYGLKKEMVKKGVHEGKMKYGYAKYLRQALPNASFIGFTGTPIDSQDKSTRKVFGDYIDIYDMTRSIEDKSTVPIFYENRVIKVNMDDPAFIDDLFEEIVGEQEEEVKGKLKSRWGRLEAVVGSEDRIKQLAKDIVTHFKTRTGKMKPEGKKQSAANMMKGKGMIVTMSRRIAVELYNEIISVEPGWHSDDDKRGKIKVVMTGGSDDPESWNPHIRKKSQLQDLAKRMKDPADELELVIVRDMWLTGFDAPSIHTIYVDKPMSGHNLMQAIARVNRVYQDKEAGLVVDYLGIMEALKSALKEYTESDRGNIAVDVAVARDLMLEKLDVLRKMIHPFNYGEFRLGAPERRLELIAEGIDLISGWEKERQDNFIRESMALIKSHALVITSPEAQKINTDVAFFQTVRSGILKLRAENSYQKAKKSSSTLNQELEDLVASSLYADKEVIDVFDTLNIEKPDISLISEEFLSQLRNTPYKNAAVELLKRLLKMKLRIVARKNAIQSKKFSEMLEDAIKRYLDKSITSFEILEELIKLAKEMQDAKSKGQNLGLNDDEAAFYDALADNESAVKLMGDKILAQIAKELKKTVVAKMTVDWKKRDAARAKVRVAIKRLLKKYKYPPDQVDGAVEKVISQTEQFSENQLVDEESEFQQQERSKKAPEEVVYDKLRETIIEERFIEDEEHQKWFEEELAKSVEAIRESLWRGWRDKPEKVQSKIENELQALLEESVGDDHGLFEMKCADMMEFFENHYPEAVFEA